MPIRCFGIVRNTEHLFKETRSSGYMIEETESVKEVVKEIKQSFRQMMDGSVAQSMRNKGVDYKLNWGATLPRLKEKGHFCYHLLGVFGKIDDGFAVGACDGINGIHTLVVHIKLHLGDGL